MRAACRCVPATCRRVGLIGAGWYGKSDLWRLIQVAPIEVVSLCDPDKQMLTGAVEIASQRQKSKKKPRTYTDYREMLKQKDLDMVEIDGLVVEWSQHYLPAIGGKRREFDVGAGSGRPANPLVAVESAGLDGWTAGLNRSKIIREIDPTSCRRCLVPM